MTSSRNMLRYIVGITVSLLLAMTRAWTITSPATISSRKGKSIRSIHSTSIRMAGSENEGGHGSYEEQYNAFAKEQQRQKREEGPRIVPQSDRIDASSTQVPLQNARRNARRTQTDPIWNYSKRAKRERDQKAQEDLEMAFLDFISCHPTKQAPQMGFMKPPEEKERQEQTKEKGSYQAFLTSLETNTVSKVMKKNLNHDAIDNEISTPEKAEESSDPNSAFVSTESNSPKGTREDDPDIVEESVPDSLPPFAEPNITSITSSEGNDDTVGDGTVSKRPSFSSSDSKSYLENLANKIKNVGSEISNLGNEIVSSDNNDTANDFVVESFGSEISNLESESEIMNIDIDIDSYSDSDSGDSVGGDTPVESNNETPETKSDSESIQKDNHYTVEVKVETTFPTGITVEGAKNGWLEFCWARGGGIVVPTDTDVSATAPSASNSNDPNEAPDSIKFQSEKSKKKAQGEKESTSSDSKVLHLPTGIPSARELIVPLGLKQELVSSTSTLDEIQAATIRRDIVTYKTTQRGFFCKDMIEGTHEGRVEFIGASYTSTRMIWTVKFQVEEDKAMSTEVSPRGESSKQSSSSNVMDFASNTKTKVEEFSKQFMDSNPGLKTMVSKANLWGSWSQFQLKTASQNLIAYLDTSADSVPVMEHTETLPVGVSPKEAMEVWYDYYWKNGGGSVPVVTSPAKGSDKRWVIPSGLEEELISLEFDHPVSESGVVGVDGEIATETEIAKAVYRVNNPNLLTYPVYYHRATVRFVRDGEGNPTQLIWKVKVKPYRKFLGGGVLFWTKNGVALAAKNLRNYLELKQLENREKELQAQLERLREQKPESSVVGNTAHSDSQIDSKLPHANFKTIRTTVSISSRPITNSIDEAKTTPENSDGDNEIQSSGENTRDKKGLQTSAKASSTDSEKQTSTTIAIPPRAIDDIRTMPINSHTRAVNDELDEEFWQ